MERLAFPAADEGCGISFLHQMSVGETYPLHRHEFYEVFFVLRGRAMHDINGGKECCMAGTAVLIRPDDQHAYSFINQWDMEMISIGVTRRVMEEILSFVGMAEAEITLGPPPRVLLEGRAGAAMADDLMRLGDIQEPGMRRAFGKAVLARLLMEITQAHPEPVGMPDWLDRLVTDMSQPENFRAGLRRMVDMSHVSQNHLNREMKRCLGLTPTAFINAKRIALAGDLLLEGQHTSLEVAGLCGFETLSHFHENFRKINGCSPREFVARHGRSKV